MSLACATDRFCVVCGQLFHPRNSMARVCSPVCGIKFGKALGKARIAKVKTERKQTKERKAALKTRRQWLAECQVVVNKYVRLRDHGKGCISCGAQPDPKFGGAMDAGHFRSVGSAPHLRFLTTQIALQCVKCNRFLSGNASEFRRGLVERIGVSKVESIEAMQGTAKWPVQYLERLKKVMSKRVRRLEKRHAMQG